MIKAYRASLLRPVYGQGLQSRIREELLLASVGQEDEGRQANEALQMRSSFSVLYKSPQQVLARMIKQLEAFQRYGEGDPTALLEMQNSSQDMQGMKELWKALKSEGIV